MQMSTFRANLPLDRYLLVQYGTAHPDVDELCELMLKMGALVHTLIPHVPTSGVQV